MNHYSNDKDINRLVREKIREGWFWKKTGKHGKLHRPDSPRYITVPCSPSDHRASRNFAKELQRLAG